MKYYLIYIVGLILLASACMKQEIPMEKEQYFKQVYLVGAVDGLITQQVNYSDEVQNTYLSVAAGGSLGLDHDVTVKLRVDEEMIANYNAKYIAECKMLPAEYFEIDGMEVTLKANSKEVYEHLPVKLKTSNIPCDSTYVIPFTIESATDSVNWEVASVLLAFDMQNAYSASYQMDYEIYKDGEINSLNFLSRTLKAVSEKEVRFYHEATVEKEENLKSSIVIRINDDNTLTLRAWHPESFVIENASGSYNAATRTFTVSYDYWDNGQRYRMEASLVRNAK